MPRIEVPKAFAEPSVESRSSLIVPSFLTRQILTRFLAPPGSGSHRTTSVPTGIW
ncbi:hypothetical protein [Streptomyces sp. NPDC057336]|uniref:hypothetical protein n=1 Tax=Streptomyces sp. NPDC057336 TaxID=3346102 RepID=UPI0036266805